MNFGPQHPAAHGVLRLILELSGETIIRADPHIGLLHRGTEKLCEYKTFSQNIPYFDRLDYVSMLAQEHCYCLCLENLAQLQIPTRAQQIRVLFIELTRILNHLLAITTHAMDVGALTPFLFAMEEREKIMEFYERISGARMHANFFRIGGINFDLPLTLLIDIQQFCRTFSLKILEMEEILNSNRIQKERLVSIGILTVQNCLEYSLSGVLVRGTGLPIDLRKNIPYENYNTIPFSISVGKNSDCYDRYLIRLAEIKSSLFIIDQILNSIVSGPIKIDDFKFTPPTKKATKTNMENLIHHFKFYTENFSLPFGENYLSVEAPKGEFGVFIKSSFSNRPFRCRIRAPGFFNLQALNLMSQNHMIADIVTIIGTQDIVFGEVDR